MNFRNSDCVTARVDYVERVDSAMCGKHDVSNFGSSFFGRIKSLSVYRSTFMTFYVDRKVLHEHFMPPQKVASLSQQERIAAAKCACQVFSIE